MAKKKVIKKITYGQLIRSICAMEGKKVEVSVGNVREIIRCLTLLEAGYMVAALESHQMGGKKIAPTQRWMTLQGPIEYIRRNSEVLAKKTALKRKKTVKKK